MPVSSHSDKADGRRTAHHLAATSSEMLRQLPSPWLGALFFPTLLRPPMHRGKAHSKRAFAPKEVCLPPLAPTGQMGGPSLPHQTGGPAKMFRQSPLPWPGALPNALSLPQRTERRHTPKRDFTPKEVCLTPLVPTKQMGGAIVPCPRRQPRKTLQPPPCQSVSQGYLSSDLPSGAEFFPLQISSAPPHKGSSLSQREECTGRNEPVSPRPGRADGGQTVPVKRFQQAVFF